MMLESLVHWLETFIDSGFDFVKAVTRLKAGQLSAQLLSSFLSSYAKLLLLVLNEHTSKCLFL